ncbi:MAG: metallophosphoesterase [candidate division WOR-3 bacterium]
MQIIHTADLHLTSKDPSRLKILEWIINKGNEKGVHLLIIAGDLFESDTDSTILRTEVRDIFEKFRAKILLLPGNHDADSYGSNYDYGQNVKQLTNKPFEQLTFNNITIAAVPYQKMRFSECIMDLTKDVDVLITHGTLYDLSILPILNEEDTKYMPIYPAEIENLARCVLLGHIHSTYIDLTYKKTKAIYSGAPIALSTKCRSPRKVALVDIDEKNCEIIPIEIDIAPYWQELDYFVFPGNEEIILNRLKQDIQNIYNKNIFPDIIINGYIEGSETEFKGEVNKIIADLCKNFPNFSLNCNNIRSWDRLLKNPFVKRFVEKTSGLEDNLRMKILELISPHLNDIVK